MKAIFNGKYFVSPDGQVFNTKGVALKYHEVNGYFKVGLMEGGKQRNYRVHRLVAMAYVPNPNGYATIDHLNGNKQDNHYSNLEWTDRRTNTIRAKERMQSGSEPKGIMLDDIVFDSYKAATRWLCDTYDKKPDSVRRELRRCATIYGHTITRLA